MNSVVSERLAGEVGHPTAIGLPHRGDVTARNLEVKNMVPKEVSIKVEGPMNEGDQTGRNRMQIGDGSRLTKPRGDHPPNPGSHQELPPLGD